MACGRTFSFTVRRQQFRLWQAQTVTETVHVTTDQEAEDTHLLNSLLESDRLAKNKHRPLLFDDFMTSVFFFYHCLLVNTVNTCCQLTFM